SSSNVTLLLLSHGIGVLPDLVARKLERVERSLNDRDPAFQLRADDGGGARLLQSAGTIPRGRADDDLELWSNPTRSFHHHQRGDVVADRHNDRPGTRQGGVAQNF